MAPRPLPPLDIRSRAGQYTERSAGLHLSQITGDILLTLDPEKYRTKEGPDEGKWMNFLTGLIFERALELAWLDKEFEGNFRPGLIRPGEFKLDGVIGTPDAFDTDYHVLGEVGRPEEYKCTKNSCRQDVTDRKFWMYWVQLKAYAKMMGVHSGALWILFINGNYSRDDSDPEAGYVIKGWEDTWTDLELDENWNMILRHARKRGWL